MFLFLFRVFSLHYFRFGSNLFLCSPLPNYSFTYFLSARYFFCFFAYGYHCPFLHSPFTFSWAHLSSLLGGSSNLPVALFLLLSLSVFILFLLLLLPLTRRIFSPCILLVFFLPCMHHICLVPFYYGFYSFYILPIFFCLLS